MCIVDTKKYLSSNGEEREYETIRPCRDAPPDRLCRNIDRRSTTARLIETKRSSAMPSPDRSSDDVIIVQGKDGRERVYHNLSQRVKRKSTVRRSKTFDTDGAPPRSPRSPASYPYREVRPAAPSPPPTGARYPPTMPSQCPLPECPMMSGALGLEDDLQYRIRDVRDDFDFVYDTPIENRNRSRRPSVSSTSADIVEAEPAKPRRRKTVSIHLPPRSNDLPTVSSPGLSSILKPEHRRNDSAKDFTPRNITPPRQSAKDAGNSDDDALYRPRPKDREKAYHRRGRANLAEEVEQRRLALLEQERYQAREDARRDKADAAKERQRQNRVASDTARRNAERAERATQEDRARELRIEGERRAAERESISADLRRASTDYYLETRRPDALPPTQSPRRLTRSYGTPAVHNYPVATTTPRDADPLLVSGSGVIAREQARLAREERQLEGSPYAGDAVQTNTDGWVQEVYVSGDLARQERMRRYREERRRMLDSEY